MPANLENSAVATGLERSVFIPIPKKGNAKECSNYHTIALISHASKVMLKILQARLQQYVNCEIPDVQAGFPKGRGTRDQIANIHYTFPGSTSHLTLGFNEIFLIPLALVLVIPSPFLALCFKQAVHHFF